MHQHLVLLLLLVLLEEVLVEVGVKGGCRWVGTGGRCQGGGLLMGVGGALVVKSSGSDVEGIL
jgi:hypothetical protein